MIFDIILQFSIHPTEPLEEIEVLTENTTCRTEYRSRRQKEYLSGMTGKYDCEVISLMYIVHNDEVTGKEHEGMHRSMACFYVSIEEPAERKERVKGAPRKQFWVLGGWLLGLAYRGWKCTGGRTGVAHQQWLTLMNLHGNLYVTAER